MPMLPFYVCGNKSRYAIFDIFKIFRHYAANNYITYLLYISCLYFEFVFTFSS